jgi:hypothetical protein
MTRKKDRGTPAEEAINAMTPAQLKAAAARGNKVAQKILARMNRKAAKKRRKDT